MFEKLAHWKKRHWFLALSGITLLLVLAFWGVYRIRLSQAYQDELEELRNAGYPVSWEEAFAIQPEIPDDENGALVLTQAAKVYVKPDDCGVVKEFVDRGGRTDYPPLGELMQKFVLEHAEKYCAANQEFIDLTLKAFKYDKFYFDCTVDNYWSKLEFSPYSTGKMLALKIDVVSNKGSSDEALNYIISWLDINKTFETPVTTRYGSYGSYEYRTIDGLEHVISLCEFNDVQLRKISDKILQQKNKDNQEKLKRKIVYSCLEGIDSFNYEFKSKSPELPVISKVLNPVIDQNTLIDLYLLREGKYVLNILHLPYLQQVKLINMVSDKSWLDNIIYLYVSSDNFSFQIVKRRIALRARFMCAVTVLAIERFKLKYKKLPEKLDELIPEFMPEMPFDPFDEKPLRYKKGEIEVSGLRYDEDDYHRKLSEYQKNNKIDSNKSINIQPKKEIVTIRKSGYIVYSVGVNMIDDGGDIKSRDDITFCVVERPVR